MIARVLVSLSIGIISFIFYPYLLRYIETFLLGTKSESKQIATTHVGDVVNGNKVVNNFNSAPNGSKMVGTVRSQSKKYNRPQKTSIEPSITNNGNLSIHQQGGTVIQNTYGHVEVPDRHINAEDIKRLSTIPKSSPVIVNCYDPEETYDFSQEIISQEIISQLKTMGYVNVRFRRTGSVPRRVKERFSIGSDEYDASIVVIDVKPIN